MKQLLLALALLLVSCATNIQMLGDARPAISKLNVKEYTEMPSNAKEIAIVTVSLYSHFGGDETKWQIVKKAASLGANGYIITDQYVENGGTTQYLAMNPRDPEPVKERPMPGFYKVSAKVFYISDDNK